ncbi:hypothetical protein [Streptomyces sp. NBC_01013]|uniref:hypothetical protein n=1 Tax=Streptomyces sp. NBC_01013 TaxID=2903718 RepID=UPI00386D1C09|nr:hypothetical protein OG538_36200 [Streptomyces sp. NBC_01013]
MTVVGDAVAAVVVQSAYNHGFPRYRYLSGGSVRDGRFHRNLRMTRQESNHFSPSCVGHLIETLRDATDARGLTLADVEWIMPDLSSNLFWRNFCQTLLVEVASESSAAPSAEHVTQGGRQR